MSRDVRCHRLRCALEETHLPAVLVHVNGFHSLHAMTQHKQHKSYLVRITRNTVQVPHTNAPLPGKRGTCSASGAAPHATANNNSQTSQYEDVSSTHQLPLAAIKIPPQMESSARNRRNHLGWVHDGHLTNSAFDVGAVVALDGSAANKKARHATANVHLYSHTASHIRTHASPAASRAWRA